MTTCDVLVLGTGGVGSAACYHLAKSGCRVIGLDQFPGGHDQGSSHGHTRIIRMAYFEHPDYVPLLRRSYQLWQELSQQLEKPLYFPVGLLEVGPPDGVVVPGVLASAREHLLPIERLDTSSLSQRFPGFRLPEGYEAVFESNAGYLLVEQCVLGHLAEAQRAGVELRVGEVVQSWSAHGDGVTVVTDRDTYQAGRLVIAAGGWSGQLLADLGVPLEVRRKHLHWYRTDGDQYWPGKGGCCFFYEATNGSFYGFPQLDDRGVKLAEHSGGTVVPNPTNDDKSVEPRDRERVADFLRTHMPLVSQQPMDHAVCYYTMSPDEHFLLDTHPSHPQVSFAAGLSGHGFKFTSVLGEILADLALRGQTDQPIDLFRVQPTSAGPKRESARTGFRRRGECRTSRAEPD